MNPVSKETYKKAKEDFLVIDQKFNELKCAWGNGKHTEEQLKVMNEWDKISAIILDYEQHQQISPNEQ